MASKKKDSVVETGLVAVTPNSPMADRAKALIRALKANDDGQALREALKASGGQLVKTSAKREWIRVTKGLVLPIKVHRLITSDRTDENDNPVIDKKTGEIAQKLDFLVEIADFPIADLEVPILCKGSGANSYTEEDVKRHGYELVTMPDGRGIDATYRFMRVGEIALLTANWDTQDLSDFIGKDQVAFVHYERKDPIPGSPNTVWRCNIVAL